MARSDFVVVASISEARPCNVHKHQPTYFSPQDSGLRGITMLIYRFLAPLLALASLAANAQEFRSLTYLDQVPVAGYKAEGGFAVQRPMKCGLDGVLYIRFASANSEPAVTLIGDDGKIISNIRLSEIPEFAQNDFYDFAPANGEVFVLSGKGKPHSPTMTSYYVSRFKIDGTYISSAVVDIGVRPDFEPRALAAFPSGNLLISGMAKGHDVPFVPFTAIFTETGQFLHQVILKDDVTDKDAKQQPIDSSFSPAQQERNLIEATYLRTADDGNIYVTRNTPRGPVFIVAADGSARRVALAPPVTGADLEGVMAGGVLLVAQHRSPDGPERHTHYLVVMETSGKKIRETVRYVHEYDKNAVGMSCYRNGTYTFIAGAPNGGLQLVRAAVQ